MSSSCMLYIEAYYVLGFIADQSYLQEAEVHACSTYRQVKPLLRSIVATSSFAFPL